MCFKDLFMCVCAYVNVFASSVCAGVRRGKRHQILWNWREVMVSYPIWVLGTELRSSVRVGTMPNHLAVSLVLCFIFLRQCFTRQLVLA